MLIKACVFLSDFPKIINVAVNAKKRGIIVLGGGLAKHHTCNANAWVIIV